MVTMKRKITNQIVFKANLTTYGGMSCNFLLTYLELTEIDYCKKSIGYN